MLKFLLAAAPYILKAPSANSKKQVARSFAALALFTMSGMALIAAAFIYISALYGLAIGFLSVSGIFLAAGGILFYATKHPKSIDRSESDAVSTDPIATHVPDAILKDPTVKRILTQISENPVAASAAAAAIGMIISRELFKD